MLFRMYLTWYYISYEVLLSNIKAYILSATTYCTSIRPTFMPTVCTSMAWQLSGMKWTMWSLCGVWSCRPVLHADCGYYTRGFDSLGKLETDTDLTLIHQDRKGAPADTMSACIACKAIYISCDLLCIRRSCLSTMVHYDLVTVVLLRIWFDFCLFLSAVRLWVSSSANMKRANPAWHTSPKKRG